MPAEDLTGRKFGKLTVLGRAPNGKNWRTMWYCKCDCGNEKIIVVSGAHLKNGHTKSCGCYIKEVLTNRNNKNKKYGHRNPRIYDCWRDMIKRCTVLDGTHSERYVLRGITVCKEWKENFECFQNWALENGYEDNLTLDRIDNDGNYCPENCRWVTLVQQANNKSNNRIIEYKGRKQTLAQWCRELNLEYRTVEARINRYKWSIEESFEVPIGMRRKKWKKLKYC